MRFRIIANLYNNVYSELYNRLYLSNRVSQLFFPILTVKLVSMLLVNFSTINIPNYVAKNKLKPLK